jgi:outer membrane protein assembly factor BamB
MLNRPVIKVFPGLIAGLAGLILCGIAQAQSPAVGDWPMLGGNMHRNMVDTRSKGLPVDWSIKKTGAKNILWRAELGSTTYGGVVVSGGKVFVGTNNDRPRDPSKTGDKGALYCLKASDGAFLWQNLHDKLPEPDKNDWPKQGVASTPSVVGDRLYYVSNRAELVCLDVAGDEKTGKAREVWKLDMVSELKVFPCFLAIGSPLVMGDKVFVVTGHGVDPETHKVPEPGAPSFVSVDRATGKVVWKDASPGDSIMEGQWSNPVGFEIGGKQQVVFPGGDGWLYGFDPETGKKLWKFDCNPKAAMFKPGGRGDKSYIMGTPVFHDGFLYASVGNNPDDGPGVGHLWCIDPARPGVANQDGVRDLSPPDQKFQPGGMNANSGLVWHLGGTLDPKPEDGREVAFGRSLSTVAVADGLLYAAELDGYLHCVDAKSGKKHWEYDLKDGTWNSPFVADGRVFIGTDSGDLFVFPHGKDKKEPTKIEMEQGLKSPPCVAGGVLYLHNGTTLFAIGTR